MNKLANKIKLTVEGLKETTWPTILIFSILYCIYVTFVNLVLFKSNILAPVSKLTGGFINQTLVVNLFSILIFVYMIIIKFGRISFADIGMKKNRLLAAVAAIAILWAAIQLLNIASGLIISGRITIFNGWSRLGASAVFGSFIGQLFGNCLFEEMAFRGFLLVQIIKKLKDKRRGLFMGLVLSQLLFSLIHIPNRILGGLNLLQILPSLVLVFILGVLFAAVYLLTDNLFLAIGIHALWNTPLLVFEGQAAVIAILIFILILPFIWDKTFGRLGTTIESSIADSCNK